MDNESVAVSVPAAEGSASGAAEDLRLGGAEGGLSVDGEGTRVQCPADWVFLSLNRLGFPAALHEGHKASIKLCESTEDSRHFQ